MTFATFTKILTKLKDISYLTYAINDKVITLIENGLFDIPDILVDALEKAKQSYEVCVDVITGASINKYIFDDFVVYETVY